MVQSPSMETLISGDGLRLHLQRWPAGPGAHGTVQIVHGLGEHMGRYAALAEVLNQAGWHVAGHDHRGHGRSEGRRASIPHSQALLADLSAVVDHVRAGPRHVLLGHSMGGLIAARFVAESLRSHAARWVRDVDGLVLSSPALAADLSLPQQLLLGLSRLAPNLPTANGLKPEWVSRDPAVVQAYVADPLVHDRVTGRLARFIIHNGAVVRGLTPRWRVPTLLMWAGADRCVAPWGSAVFAGAAPEPVVDAQAFDGLYHEIFNEPERAQVIERLLGWLKRFEDPAG